MHLHSFPAHIFVRIPKHHKPSRNKESLPASSGRDRLWFEETVQERTVLLLLVLFHDKVLGFGVAGIPDPMLDV